MDLDTNPRDGMPIDHSVHVSNNVDDLSADVAEQPRLGIVHFMLWITGCAILLAASRAFSIDFADRDLEEVVVVPPSNYYQIRRVLTVMVNGAAVGSLFVLVNRWRTGVSFPVFGGQWLLVILGFMLMIHWSIWGVLFSLYREEIASGDSIHWKVSMLIYPATHLFGAVAFAVAALRSRKERRWSIILAIAALVYLLNFVGIWLNSVGMWFFWDFSVSYGMSILLFLVTYTLLGAALAVGVVNDIRERARRDFLHWTGIAVTGYHVLSTWLTMILSWLNI